MSLKRVLRFDVNRILRFDLNRILSFDLNRIGSWDVGRALQWHVPPMLLRGLAGWFLAAIALDVMGMWGSGFARSLAAASAAALALTAFAGRRRSETIVR